MEGITSLALYDFQADSFDCSTYILSTCHPLSEKGVRKLQAELGRLKRQSAEEMRLNALSNYAAFIRTLYRISALEGSLQSMQSLLSSQEAIIHGMAMEGSIMFHVSDTELKSNIAENYEPSETLKSFNILLEEINMFLIECKVEKAVEAVVECERLLEIIRVEDKQEAVRVSEIALAEQRGRFIRQLTETTQQHFVRGIELRTAIAALKRLDDGSKAHDLLLISHHKHINHGMKNLHFSGTSSGGSYTAALSQLVFSEILQAVKDSYIVFGDLPAYASKVVLWACMEIACFVNHLKKHVLLVAGRLLVAVECVRISYGHCLLLKDHGLALCHVLYRSLKPTMSKILMTNLAHMKDTITAVTAADDWLFICPVSSTHSTRKLLQRSGGGRLSTSDSPAKLSASATHVARMAQDFAEDVEPLVNMQLGISCLNGLTFLFDSYIDLLVKAMSKPNCNKESDGSDGQEKNIIKTAEATVQQLAILGNASFLCDDVLPYAAIKLAPGGRYSPRESFNLKQLEVQELVEWKYHLQDRVKKLQDSFCEIRLKQFIESASVMLTPDIFLNPGDGSRSLSDILKDASPSPFFQVFFLKLIEIRRIAADVLSGRYEVVKIPLTKIIEKVLSWLYENQDFWKAIEESKKPLKIEGLLQFMLDMQFMVQSASSGSFCSEKLQDITSDLICRAQNIYAENGYDVSRYVEPKLIPKSFTVPFQHSNYTIEAKVGSAI